MRHVANARASHIMADEGILFIVISPYNTTRINDHALAPDCMRRVYLPGERAEPFLLNGNREVMLPFSSEMPPPAALVSPEIFIISHETSHELQPASCTVNVLFVGLG